MADNGDEKRPDLTVDSGSQAPIEDQQKSISDRNEMGPTDFGADSRPADENNDRDEGEGEAESVASKDELRLSKARCIALVCTVTGASFLNVSTSVSISQYH
jgi:hypothetical protein